jgi:hypothetical protein
VNTIKTTNARRLPLGFTVLATALFVCACGSDSGVTSTTVGVGYGYGYGGYYGPGWYGGYYDPYPPVVVVPPGERPDRPDRPDGGNRPTTLPAEVARGPSSMAPSRPPSSSRPTTRPAPRPAPRPMPRGRR